MTGIEVLEEILGSLKITEEYVSDRNRITEPTLSEEMSIAPILAVHDKTAQTVMPKSMVSDPGWFDSNQMKFKD